MDGEGWPKSCWEEGFWFDSVAISGCPSLQEICRGYGGRIADLRCAPHQRQLCAGSGLCELYRLEISNIVIDVYVRFDAKRHTIMTVATFKDCQTFAPNANYIPNSER